jgi:hypothetical protein
MNIFVSSTVKDLGDLRNELYHHLKELGHTPWFSEMDDFPINHHPDSMTNCLIVAEQSDYFLVLLDKRSGLPYTERADSPYHDLFDLTISEAEYKCARKKDIPICIFVRTKVDCESAIFRQIDKEQRKTINWYSEPAIYEFYDRLMHEKPHIPWRYTFDSIEDIINPLKKIIGATQDEEELNEEIILQIQTGEKKDILQKHMDKIIKSYNDEELSLFRDLIEILDIKWNIIMDDFNKSSNTRPISSYFGEHYRKIIFKLIERKADYDYYYPIILSFQNNVEFFLSLKERIDESTYSADSSYFANVFSLIVEKSIEESNWSVFGITIDKLIDQMESAIEFQMDDFHIWFFYIRNFKQIIKTVCERKFEIDFISVRLSWIGRHLAKSEFVESLMQLLNIFDSLIDSELKWSDDDNNLIITVRSLMYIWVRCGSSKLMSCNEKIISILKKIDVLPPHKSVTLSIAYDKTEELLQSDDEIDVLPNIINKLDILNKLRQ